MHNHEAVETIERKWTHCVNPNACVGKSDGNVVIIEYCSCGAEQRTEVNGFGRYSETSSGWMMDEGNE